MFNFIQLIDLDTNKPVPMDFRAFRIVGFDEVQADTYIKDEEKKKSKKKDSLLNLIIGYMVHVIILLIRQE